MDGAYDIPDSTDWLSTPLQAFTTLEGALHCQICKEFYNTPMLTSCSHTFCSKCIRTSLSTDGKCPACRTADQASKLRNNWALEEVVSNFQTARPAALKVARAARDDAAESKKPSKRKRVAADEDDAQEGREARTTRSKSRRIAASQTSQPDIVEIEDSDGDSTFEQESALEDDGLVECPLGCGKRMKIEAVEPHLDRCEDEQKQASRAKSRTPVNAFGSSRPPSNSTQSARPQDRISELSYSLLTETKLRRKLDELGIPSWGPKAALVKRHTEWVNLWNANCDSNHPRTKRELLHELDVWERTQGGRAPGMSNLASNVMRKDFNGAVWVNKNKDDFSRLIAEAKRKKNYPALQEDKPKGPEKAMNSPFDEFARSNEDLATNGEPTTSDNAYEDNMEAIATIRDKVNAINSGEQIESIENQRFETTQNSVGVNGQTESRNDETESGNDDMEAVKAPPGVDNAALLEQNHFGVQNHYVAEPANVNGGDGALDNMPPYTQSSPRKKVPMFAMPQQPVTDLDGGGGGGGTASY